jgi:hypothetical protein
MGSTVSPSPLPMPTPSSSELPIQEATLDLIRWFLPILHRLPRQHRPHRLHRLPRLHRPHRLHRLPRRHRQHRHRPCAFPFADAPLLLLCRDP